MRHDSALGWTLPREEGLGLVRRVGADGLEIAVLPNGALFSIVRHGAGAPVMVNQILGSPVGGGLAGPILRVAGQAPIEACGARAARFGADAASFVWEGEAHGLLWRASLASAPSAPAWVWRLEIDNRGPSLRALDALLIQDLGLGPRGFLMGNEAYASQYIDHFIADHPRFGPVVMSRQNLAQDGAHPLVLHGCLDGAAGFSTDGKELFGPAARDGGRFSKRYGEALSSRRLQHEMACVGLASRPLRLEPGERTQIRWFGLFVPDQPVASSASDLERLEPVEWPRAWPAPAMATPRRSLVELAEPLAADAPDEAAIDAEHPARFAQERAGGRLQSFFVDEDDGLNRHVVAREKELAVTRRHGAILRTGTALLPDDATMCATAWAHGVFAAQLTLGNTSFHKLFSVSRDPYNVTRASGLRLVVEIDGEWRLLGVPSLFENGLSDCRWIYRLGAETISVALEASGADPVMILRVSCGPTPRRFIAFGQLVLGEREYEHAGHVEIDAARKRATLRPGADFLWGQRYPQARLDLVALAPDEIEAIGGQGLLHDEPGADGGGFIVLRTRETCGFAFAITGDLNDFERGGALAARAAQGFSREDALDPAQKFWRGLTRGATIEGDEATAALFPWLVQNALVHLSVPHGLEQYTGAAWGVRDVCQGPLELLLALRHDAPARDILRVVFEQQYEDTADWPQWFMLAPYGAIQDRSSHGDVIVWPLKAVCDYVEATGDFTILDEELRWRDRKTLERTARAEPLRVHLARLIDAARARFLPGTHLIRYGEGDWNDSLQPADPRLRDRMVSSWTAALLYQQLLRYAAICERSGRTGEADELRALAQAMSRDFRALLMREGVVAGYGLFGAAGEPPELLLHPSDRRTGLKLSLLAIERAIAAGLLTEDEIEAHLSLIREKLLYPDGARLMDRPVAYRGGPETLFRRAESASFFGREIGLMYTHEHLRYAELIALRGERAAFLEALAAVNPVCVGEVVETALPRQRNAFFSSSDAAFPDRASASADWDALRAGRVGVEGGWRVYSSGPGIFVNLLIAHAFGRRRDFGRETRADAPGPRLAWDLDASA